MIAWVMIRQCADIVGRQPLTEVSDCFDTGILNKNTILNSEFFLNACSSFSQLITVVSVPMQRVHARDWMGGKVADLMP